MLDTTTNSANQRSNTGFLPRLKQFSVGLAEDFWKDGPENPFAFIASWMPKRSETLSSLSGTALKTLPAEQKKMKPGEALWHAAPGEISEKMWGEGFVTPGGATVTDMLIKPLGLTKEMNVLDLSAGLGGRMRKITREFGAYITGLEPDPGIAARGMELSLKAGKGKHAPITHYDSATFFVERMYDCIIARETFYRVADKKLFFEALATCSKPGAQIAFTDYIVDPENRDQPAVKAWRQFEKGAAPLGLVEMAEAWAKTGYNLRVNEDLTDYYTKEATIGLRRLAHFLASGVHPDAETKQVLSRRIQTWMHRMAAIEQGMKFYRFYGTKQ